MHQLIGNIVGLHMWFALSLDVVAQLHAMLATVLASYLRYNTSWSIDAAAR